MKNALSQLQDQIEAIRKEAYNAGYAAAMQSIRDFAARPSTPAAAPARGRRPARSVSAPKAAAAPAPAAKRKRGPAAKPKAGPAPRRGRPPTAKPASAARRRPQRGSNARLIAEVLKTLPSGTGRPADIRKALQSDKGVTMAYTSIRHSLGQLAARDEVQASSDGKTWRYSGG
jgi:hypothetical protein